MCQVIHEIGCKQQFVIGGKGKLLVVESACKEFLKFDAVSSIIVVW